MPYPYVPRISLNPDDSVALDVTIVGFDEGKWADISGYVIQNDNAFPFSAIQEVPAPDSTGAASLTVTLPPMEGLTLEQDVTVITRVAEVLIWPTVLAYSSDPDSGFKATWLAKSDSSTSNVQTSQPGTAASAPQSAAAAGSSGLSVTVVGLQEGTKYLITVEPVPPSKPAARTSSRQLRLHLSAGRLLVEAPRARLAATSAVVRPDDQRRDTQCYDAENADHGGCRA